MEIYLIRHTTPLIAKGICYGQSDISVGDDFETESKRIIEVLPHHIDAIHSSPLSRCTILSEKIILEKCYPFAYTTDTRLIEMYFGRWELKKWCEIDEEEFKYWENNVVLNSVSGGESFAELNNRVNEFLQDLMMTNHDSVIVVTHAGVIRCLSSIINNIPLIETLKITIDYGSVIILKVK